MIEVCTSEDDFTRERWLTHVRWVVLLSNGEQVIQDDGRPGPLRESAWIRLGKYVQERGLKIQQMSISFRNEPPIRLPDQAEGYFFRTSVGGLLTSELTFEFYLVGYLRNEKVMVQRFKVPELILVQNEVRNPSDEETVGSSLIRQ